MQINIEKRHLFLISALFVFLAGIIVAVAYGGTSPATMGHSSGEVSVTINGNQKTLQEAIDDGSISGSYNWVANCDFQTKSASGDWTLQCSIDEYLVDVWCSDEGNSPDCSVIYGFGGKLTSSGTTETHRGGILCCK